jgi:lipopolysaccharide/colanic/teichoic acid biosynthesis glycosyltransferase
MPTAVRTSPPIPAASDTPLVPGATVVEGLGVVPPEGPRRWVNVGVASALLLISLPAMLLIAVLIKLTSPGPVLYTQTRIGVNRRLPVENPGRRVRRRTCDLGGRPFVIYKFRTMRANAERRSGAVWAERNDPRVTWIGRLLRQTRLDELPQLFNVLNGDMNLVGPRPERPSIFARLADQLEQYPLRQWVRPGITGLAQVSQQYDTCLDDVRRKLAYDLEYIQTQGVWTDLRIMLKTVPVILFRRGGW